MAAYARPPRDPLCSLAVLAIVAAAMLFQPASRLHSWSPTPWDGEAMEVEEEAAVSARCLSFARIPLGRLFAYSLS